jgi:hypothetical protein
MRKVKIDSSDVGISQLSTQGGSRAFSNIHQAIHILKALVSSKHSFHVYTQVAGHGSVEQFVNPWVNVEV